MQLIDLFHGIGGFSLAGRWAGWHTVQGVEIDPFCQKVFAYHFPQAALHNDIKTFNLETLKKSKWNPNADTIICGGFPCQPYSLAGERKGTADARHLWPEMLRTIKEVRPRWVVGENVFGLVNWNGGVVFEQVQTDLEAAGYEVQSFILPACAVNAPHRRDRVWVVAHAIGNGGQEQPRGMGCTTGQDDRERARFIYDADKPNGEMGTTPHAHRNGQHTGNGEREEHAGEGWQHAQHNIEPGVNDEPFTNAENNGHERQSRGSGNRKTGRFFEKGQFEGSELERGGEAVTHPESWRLPQRDGEQAQHGTYPATERYDSISQWQNFPTQPPVRTGNDGLPSRLAGITVPKHRNESIKGAGNAIVPQVAYQIFMVINEYESILKQQS